MASSVSPLRTGLPREVLQWLQNLELSVCHKNVRRDFSNGYLVADIFSRYYPKVFLLHSYKNGAALAIKQDNWARIQKFLQKLNISLSQDLIHGTIALEMGAAAMLLTEIYSILTNQSPSFGSSMSTASSELRVEKERREKHHFVQKCREKTHSSVVPSSSGQATVLFKVVKVHQPARRYIQQ